MAAAIEENVLDFLVLHPKSQNQSREKDIFGQICGLRDRKIYIEIFRESFRSIRKSYKNESYDISFLLNRMPYQVQHNALDFIENDQLFTKLINNSYYGCKSESLPLSNGKPNIQKHQFK